MNEELELMLTNMTGKDVNIYICGKVTNYQQYEDMEFWIEELLTGDNLVISSQGEEKYFYIALDDIQDIKICKELNEIRFIYDNM